MNITIGEVKALYVHRRYTKTKTAQKLNVSFEELSHFMKENDITRAFTNTNPIGRVPCSQSPIYDSTTVTAEMLGNMARRQ